WGEADVPDPQDEATFLRSRLDWSEPGRDGHRELLTWYRELIALRRARPELTDPRLGQVRVCFDEDERWLVTSRGRLRIAANLSPQPRRLPLGGAGAAVLAASGPGVTVEGSRAVLPATTLAVIETAPLTLTR
ncbi:MAG: DUF3459 domain-containing protein, partial [Actinobacteria bacterium]|nr:DUF3459 domain-containing protein [Actinomycetota bacterium]